MHPARIKRKRRKILSGGQSHFLTADKPSRGSVTELCLPHNDEQTPGDPSGMAEPVSLESLTEKISLPKKPARNFLGIFKLICIPGQS